MCVRVLVQGLPQVQPSRLVTLRQIRPPLLVLVMLLAGLAFPPSLHAQAARDAGRSGTILNALRTAFRDTNPAIERVAVLEVRSADSNGRRYALLARGTRADGEFRGNFADELFGVFVVNDSLTDVLSVLDVFPTARWRDFDVRFTRVTADSLYVAGAGATYGDQPLERVYVWR